MIRRLEKPQESTPMLAQAFTHAQIAHPCRAWDAATLWARPDWRVRISAPVLDEALTFIPRSAGSGAEAALGGPYPAFARLANEIRERLISFEGVCWIRGLDDWGLSQEEQRSFYRVLGSALGRPLMIQGHLYSLEDQEAPAHRAHGAATNGFYTQSSSVDLWPDIMGLLCEQPGTVGGESLITNTQRAHRELCFRVPQMIDVLEQDFIRDIQETDYERTRANLLRNRFPIFAGRGCRRTFRYRRSDIESGQRSAGRPLSAESMQALNVLDRILASPEHVVRFRLERGDMLFTDNRIVAYDRVTYRDSFENTRRLRRMWLATP